MRQLDPGYASVANWAFLCPSVLLSGVAGVNLFSGSLYISIGGG